MRKRVPSSSKNSVVSKLPSADTPLSLRKRLTFFILLITFPYLIIEALFSVLYVHGAIYPPTGGWFFENTGRTIHFDPIRGYRLTSTPSRVARITKGKVEYVGTFRGNSQGFPDRDDFSPGRSTSKHLRIAVFGDSFTAAQYLKQNWPDALEDIANGSENLIKVELLNFSVDGGGLANWWSILIHIIKKEKYEIDGPLFAVYPGDLYRGFSISEHRGYSRHMFARVKSWNPENWPKNIQEARVLLKPLNGYIVPEDQFSKALNGKWHPELSRPWRFYFSIKVLELIKTLVRELKDRFFVKPSFALDVGSGDIFNQEQKEFIRQISNFSQANSLPVIVVHIPSRKDLIKKKAPSRDILLFSKLLNGTFIDGSEAFSGLTETEIRSHFLPFDGYWGQSGSNRFAYFLFDKLKKHSDDLFRRRSTDVDDFRDNSND